MPHRQLVYTMTINYLPHKSYKSEFCVQPHEILKKTEEVFFKEIFKEIKKITKVTGTLLHIQEEKKSMYEDDALLDQAEVDEAESLKARSNLGEMHESSDEEIAAEDADATLLRTISRHRENQEYEDPEDEEEIEDINEKDDENENEKSETNEQQNDDDDTENEYVIDEIYNKERKKHIQNKYNNAIEYDYDENKFTWCKLKFWVGILLNRYLYIFI